jgi:cell division protein FtsQ
MTKRKAAAAPRQPAQRQAGRNPTAKPRARTGASTGASTRRAPPPARAKPSRFGRIKLRTSLRLGAGALVLGTGLWAWQSGFVERQYTAAVDGLYAASADVGLRLANVHVVGRARTDRAEILEAVALKQGEPILTLDLHAARERLEALPWVMEATVERRLPDLVYVTLVERKAMAIWQLDGSLSVVDQAGEVIADAKAEDFAGLPLIVGPGAADAAEGLFVLLATEPELASRVEAAVRVGERRWNLRIDPGIDVRLPEEGAVEAWQMLGRIDRENGLLSRDVVVIDLRQPDRLLVRPAPGVEVPPPAEPVEGEDT